MGVVYLPGSFFRIADGGEGVVAENDRIVLAEEFRMEQYPPLEIDLTQSSAVFIFPERDEFPGKTHGLRSQSFLAEKKRGKIRSEGFREHDIEPLRSSAVQEHIVDNTNFILLGHKNGVDFVCLVLQSFLHEELFYLFIGWGIWDAVFHLL